MIATPGAALRQHVRRPSPNSRFDAGWKLRAVGLPVAATLSIAVGLLLGAASTNAELPNRIWLIALLVLGAPVVWRTLREASRGHFATDMVAMLAIVGAVLVGEPLAGLIVVLMQTGGEALERYAAGRASEAVRSLEAAAPRRARRVVGDAVQDIAAEEIRIGDLLLVRPGELIAADCEVVTGSSHVDASQLTGEAMPVRIGPGSALLAGSANIDGVVTVRATARAAESQYALIVEMVRSAQSSKSPLQRLADRYAVWFTPLVVLVAIAAYVMSGDPIRVLAVLVVATPCPLIIATPVAIIGGINRAAQRQVIVRNGAALEQLAEVTVAVFDKTGTLTVGLPRVSTVRPTDGWTESALLQLAAAVEQHSGHLLARTTVEAALERGIIVPESTRITEAAGQGVSGVVNGAEVAIGSRSFIISRAPEAAPVLERLQGSDAKLRAWMTVDGRAAGIIEYADQVRPELPRLLRELRSLGIERFVLLSGDAAEHTRAVGTALGLEDIRGELLPADKVSAIREITATGARVVMLGDGTNDAPALSSATVGMALAGHGGGITAEAADVVLLVDDPSRMAESIAIGRRTMRIARESIWAGLGLSAVAMAFAAAGHIPPIAGALLQEVIDVAVILNALRASR